MLKTFPIPSDNYYANLYLQRALIATLQISYHPLFTGRIQATPGTLHGATCLRASAHLALTACPTVHKRTGGPIGADGRLSRCWTPVAANSIIWGHQPRTSQPEPSTRRLTGDNPNVASILAPCVRSVSLGPAKAPLQRNIVKKFSIYFNTKTH